MRFSRSGILSFFILGSLLLNISHMAIAADDEEPLFLFRGTRPLGLGNAFEAVADDINALHYNPAGLAQIDKTLFQFLAIRARVTQDLAHEFDTIDEFINETMDLLTKSDDPLTDSAAATKRRELVNRADELLAQKLGLDLGLPSFGLIVPVASSESYKATLGVSLYTQGVANVEILKRGLPWRDAVMERLDNHVIYRVTGQIALATALAVQIPMHQPFLKSVSFGGGVRFIRRGTLTDEDDPFEIVDILDPDEFKEKYFNFDEEEGFGDFAQENVDFASGHSVDLGVLLTPVHGLNVGLALRNAVSSISVGNETQARAKMESDCEFPRNFVVSIAAKPLELLNSYNSALDLTLAASLDDPNGDDRLGEFELESFNDRLHLGAEVILWPESLLSIGLRAGINQGFATYGATLRLLKFLNLHVARYANLEADWNVGSLEISF